MSGKYECFCCQDELIAIDCFNGDPDQAFFAVYDGHGGRGAVDFTVRALHLVRANAHSPCFFVLSLSSSCLDVACS